MNKIYNLYGHNGTQNTDDIRSSCVGTLATAKSQARRMLKEYPRLFEVTIIDKEVQHPTANLKHTIRGTVRRDELKGGDQNAKRKNNTHPQA